LRLHWLYLPSKLMPAVLSEMVAVSASIVFSFLFFSFDDGMCFCRKAEGQDMETQGRVPTVCSQDPSRDWFMGIRHGLHWNTRRLQGK